MLTRIAALNGRLYAPEEGAPYVAEEVSVSTQAGHVLAGTLTIPKDVNQPLPGVILITGSKPMNRDFSPAYVTEYRPIVRLLMRFHDGVSLF